MNTDFLYQIKVQLLKVVEIQIKPYLHPMRQKWGNKSGDSELSLCPTF